jgi:hypothetical protein
VADLTLRDVIAPIVRDLLAVERSEVLMISQRNCEAVLGIPPRTHLENCRRTDFTPKVTRLGKLRLVDAVEYRLWLRGRCDAVAASRLEKREDGAAELLAEIGLFSSVKGAVDRGRPGLTADRAGPKVR